MAFINIPESKLSATVASQVGKLQGLLSLQVNKGIEDIKYKLSQNTPPSSAELEKIIQFKDSISKNVTQVSNRLDKLNQIPQKIKPPLQGLQAVSKLILSLPIPQAVPPGVGLPVNVTTKYADLLVTTKETIKQINDNVDSIERTLKGPTENLAKTKKRLSFLDIGLLLGKLENKFSSLLSSGGIPLQVLINLGLADSDGFLSISKLRPNLIKNIDTGDMRQFSDELNDINNKIQSSSEIDDTIKSDLTRILITIPYDELYQRNTNALYSYKGFDLSIEEDRTSPPIARRHYAIAKNRFGVVVMKGEPSFSSSTEVLIDELKFKIDTQLQ